MRGSDRSHEPPQAGQSSAARQGLKAEGTMSAGMKRRLARGVKRPRVPRTGTAPERAPQVYSLPRRERVSVCCSSVSSSSRRWRNDSKRRRETCPASTAVRSAQPGSEA